MNIFGFNIDKGIIFMIISAFLGIGFLFSFIALIISVKANKKIKKFINYNKKIDVLDAVTNYYEKCKEIENNHQKIIDRYPNYDMKDFILRIKRQAQK